MMKPDESVPPSAGDAKSPHEPISAAKNAVGNPPNAVISSSDPNTSTTSSAASAVIAATQASDAQSAASGHSGHALRHELRVWTRDLLIAIGLALVIIVFLYQPVKVEGTSMAPLLSDQERIFINKFVYRFEPITRGDVVVFWYPLDRSKSFIKRV